MFLNLYWNVFLLIFLFKISISNCEDKLKEQPELESKCAPYCLKVLLWNTVSTNQKMEECERRSMQMAALQSQLAVSKLREKMYEKEIEEKKDQCKLEAKIHSDLYEMNKKLENITAHSLKQLEDARRTIELRNERINALESALQINNYILESCKTNFSSNPAALIIMDTKREIVPKVYESSCINIGNSSDIWEIKVPGIEPFEVPCDGTIAGPGWTVIQRRLDNTVDFNRNWSEYKKGFGDLEGTFFIGLEKLHRMTNSRPHELYIHMKNFNNAVAYARYDNFSVGSEEDDYILHSLGNFKGDVGDSLQSNVGMKFSTFDRNNGKRPFDNCAVEHHGGWWYNQCTRANLNGRYMENEWVKWDGIWWWSWQNTITLNTVQMLIRPKEQRSRNLKL